MATRSTTTPTTGQTGPDEVVPAGPLMMTKAQAKGSLKLAAITGLVGALLGLLVGAVIPITGIDTGLRVAIAVAIGATAGIVAGYIGGAFQSEVDGGVDELAKDPEFRSNS